MHANIHTYIISCIHTYIHNSMTKHDKTIPYNTIQYSTIHTIHTNNTHAYIHTYIHTHMHTHTHRYIYPHIHTYVRESMHA